jgi:hypothetical protein
VGAQEKEVVGAREKEVVGAQAKGVVGAQEKEVVGAQEKEVVRALPRCSTHSARSREGGGCSGATHSARLGEGDCWRAREGVVGLLVRSPGRSATPAHSARTKVGGR